MNHELLKKIGYNSVALEMLLKREAQINPDDIIMPGEYRSLNNNTDQDATEISLYDIQKQFNTLEETIKSLPDEYDDNDYFGVLKQELISVLLPVKLKIESLFTEAGLDIDEM